MLEALDHGEKVVPGELAADTAETAAAVREQELRLAVAARVEQHLAGRGVARVVLELEPGLRLPERDPHGLAAPADVDEVVRVGQQLYEVRARPRGALLLEHRP